MTGFFQVVQISTVEDDFAWQLLRDFLKRDRSELVPLCANDQRIRLFKHTVFR